MKNINLVNDVVPPLVVAAVDIVAGKSTRTLFGQPIQRVLNYAMTGGGYLAAAMGWGGKYGDALKNLAIASAPGTIVALYNQVVKPTTPVVIQNRMSMTRVSRYPAPATTPGFQTVRLD